MERGGVPILREILKYELKSKVKGFIQLHGSLLCFAVVVSVYMRQPKYQVMGFVEPLASILTIILTIVSMVSLVVAFPITFISHIVDFYKNYLGNGNYPTHTLPVSANIHLLAKVISGMMWLCASVVVTVTGILILMRNYGAGEAIVDELKVFFLDADLSLPFMMLISLIVFLSWLLSFFAAISWGSCLLKDHRFAGFLLAYFIIYGAFRALFYVILLSSIYITGTNDQDALSVGVSGLILIFSALGDPFKSAIWEVVISYAIAAMGSYILAHFMIKRRLDVS